LEKQNTLMIEHNTEELMKEDLREEKKIHIIENKKCKEVGVKKAKKTLEFG